MHCIQAALGAAAALKENVQANYTMQTMARARVPGSDTGGLPKPSDGPIPALFEIPMSTILDRTGLPIDPTLVRFVAVGRPGAARLDIPRIIAQATLKEVQSVCDAMYVLTRIARSFLLSALMHAQDWSMTASVLQRITDIQGRIDDFMSTAVGQSAVNCKGYEECVQLVKEAYECSGLSDGHPISLQELPVRGGYCSRRAGIVDRVCM